MSKQREAIMATIGGVILLSWLALSHSGLLEERKEASDVVVAAPVPADPAPAQSVDVPPAVVPAEPAAPAGSTSRLVARFSAASSGAGWIVKTGPLSASGFETGDLTSWSTSFPQPPPPPYRWHLVLAARVPASNCQPRPGSAGDPRPVCGDTFTMDTLRVTVFCDVGVVGASMVALAGGNPIWHYAGPRSVLTCPTGAAAVVNLLIHPEEHNPFMVCSWAGLVPHGVCEAIP